MKSSKHMIVAGALQVAQSFMLLVFGSIYTILYIRDLQEGSHDFELTLFLMLALALFIGICQLWFGISLAMQKRWTTRRIGFICCAPSLIGSYPPVILGAYTIWVLVQAKKKEAHHEG